jgi:hypothetical protein
MSNEFTSQPLNGSPTPEPGPGQRQVVLEKDGQRYIFRYTPGEEAELLSSLAQMAKDPDCPIDWYDAAMLSHQMGLELSAQLQRMAPR